MKKTTTVEQLFALIIENLMSAMIFFLITLETFPVYIQSYCQHSSEGFVLAKMSFVCLCWVFNVVS